MIGMVRSWMGAVGWAAAQPSCASVKRPWPAPRSPLNSAASRKQKEAEDKKLIYYLNNIISSLSSSLPEFAQKRGRKPKFDGEEGDNVYDLFSCDFN